MKVLVSSIRKSQQGKNGKNHFSWVKEINMRHSQEETKKKRHTKMIHEVLSLSMYSGAKPKMPFLPLGNTGEGFPLSEGIRVDTRCTVKTIAW